MKKLKEFQTIMDNKEILYGLVTVVKYDLELATDILILNIDGVTGIIVRDEVDIDSSPKSLICLLGKNIKFIIKKIDTDRNVLICSRKCTQ